MAGCAAGATEGSASTGAGSHSGMERSDSVRFSTSAISCARRSRSARWLKQAGSSRKTGGGGSESACIADRHFVTVAKPHVAEINDSAPQPMSPYPTIRPIGERSRRHPDGEEAHGGGGFVATMPIPAPTVAPATITSAAGNPGLVVQPSGLVAEDRAWTPMSEQPEQPSASSAQVITAPTRRHRPPSRCPLGMLAETFM